jgi:hypothetical protein
VLCGLTYAAARKHSIPQLRLMCQASQRIDAGRGLMTARITFSAMAACWSEDGSAMYQKTQDDLAKLAAVSGGQERKGRKRS